MGTLLDNGKYQVLENLFSESGYTASVCIDVETKNNYKPLIFNIYSQPELINAYLPLFYSVGSGTCDDYHRVIPGDRCIMAVFSYHHGTPLIDHIKTLPKKDYPARAALIGSFLDAAIVLDMLPPVFALSVLTPPNTVFDTKENAVRFNFLINPRADASEGALTGRAAEEKRALFLSYLENAIVKNRYLPQSASDFLEDMRTADISKLVPICAQWRQVNSEALEEHKLYLSESFLAYIKRRLRTKLRKRK